MIGVESGLAANGLCAASGSVLVTDAVNNIIRDHDVNHGNYR